MIFEYVRIIFILMHSIRLACMIKATVEDLKDKNYMMAADDFTKGVYELLWLYVYLKYDILLL